MRFFNYGDLMNKQFKSYSWELAYEPVQEAYRSWVTEQALLINETETKTKKGKKK
jgi:hypothetical protein